MTKMREDIDRFNGWPDAMSPKEKSDLISRFCDSGKEWCVESFMLWMSQEPEFLKYMLVTEVGGEIFVADKKNLGIPYGEVSTNVFHKSVADRHGSREAKGKPSTKDMAKNLSSELGKHMRNGFKNADPQTVEQRVSICSECDKMGSEGVWKNRCMVCGCFMKVKAKWASSKCPLDKW